MPAIIVNQREIGLDSEIIGRGYTYGPEIVKLICLAQELSFVRDFGNALESHYQSKKRNIKLATHRNNNRKILLTMLYVCLWSIISREQ